MDLGRRSFLTPAGWFFARSRTPPPALMLRSRALNRVHPRLPTRCGAASRSMRARAAPSFETGAVRALLRMRRLNACRVRGSSLIRCRSSISRCQTAHLIPAARFCARGLQLCFAHPERGVGGAPRVVRVQRHPLGVHITRHARRLARRLASLGVGRSPLGAPPWRFFTRGRASVSGITPDPCSELLAARS
jgi:hypothetical protein